MTWQTHDVFNQFDELSDCNVLTTDAALAEAVGRAEVDALRRLLVTPPDALEGRGRRVAQRLVRATRAALLRKPAPAAVADAFIATRLGEAGEGRVVGALDARRIDTTALRARALPA